MGEGVAKTVVLALTILFISSLTSLVGTQPESRETAPSMETPPAEPSTLYPEELEELSCFPGYFIENRGQIPEESIKYYAPGNPLSIGIKSDGVRFVLQEDRAIPPEDPIAIPRTEARRTTFDLVFEGCEPVVPEGRLPMETSNHFLIGNDPSRWKRGVASFKEVYCEDLYPGVDLRFYFREGMFKYDLALDRADLVDLITPRYQGVEGLRRNEATRDLLIDTAITTISDDRPVIFLEREGDFEEIQGEFELLQDDRFQYSFGDGVLSEVPVIIDPGLIYSSFLGGSDREMVVDAIKDTDGHWVVLGETASSDFHTEPGALDDTHNGGMDVFIVKIDPANWRVVSSTFIGGDGWDEPTCCRETSDGDYIIYGYTESTDIPVTHDAMFPGPIGGLSQDICDCFIIKVDRNCSMLEYGTYLGGTDADSSYALLDAPDGSYYITGMTLSDDLPSTASAYCATRNGNLDIFVGRLDEELSRIVFLSYYGGSSLEVNPHAAVDVDGNIVVCGRTASSDIDLTDDAMDDTLNGENDIFLLKMNVSGNLLYSSYFGGSLREAPTGIISLGDSGICIVGQTTSPDFCTTADALRHPQSFVDMGHDGFITLVTCDLSEVSFSTLFGSDTYYDLVLSAQFSPSNDLLYFIGVTMYGRIPTTQGAFQPNHTTLDVGDTGFFAVLDLANRTVEYCTLLGANDTTPWRIIIEEDGTALISGHTHYPDFPTTRDAVNSTHHGDYDVFISKIDPEPCGPPNTLLNLTAIPGDGCMTIRWDPIHVICNGSLLLKGMDVHRSREGGVGRTYLGEIPWNQTEFRDPLNPMNGVNYTYMFTVRSSGGSTESSIVGRPIGPISEVVGLEGRAVEGNVTLDWSPPVDNGGGLDISYRLFRDGLWLVDTSVCTFTDTEVILGTDYVYAVQARNELFGSRNVTVTVKACERPGPPSMFSLEAGDEEFVLRWDQPASTGGVALQGFVLYRLDEEGDLVYSRSLSVVFAHTEPGTNGLRSGFYLTAFNAEGESGPTETLSGVPFGMPGEVRNLRAEAGDGTVSLFWDEADGNGREVELYHVYSGTSLEQMVKVGSTTNTVYLDTDRSNGITYYYFVLAENEAGIGKVQSDTVSAQPIGPPGPPMDFMGSVVSEGIELTWEPPVTMGGAVSVVYNLRKRPGEGVFVIVTEGLDRRYFLDVQVVPGTTYSYELTAENSAGTGVEAIVTNLTVAYAPGPVQNQSTVVGDRSVKLVWETPLSDGGFELTAFQIHRGISADALSWYDSVGLVTEYTDTDVTPGQLYYYTVRAVNSRISEVGLGETMEPIAVKALIAPGPIDVDYVVTGDSIEITWMPSALIGQADITGYVIYKGTSEGLLEELSAVEPTVLSFKDKDVERGRSYWYRIVASSEIGPGEHAKAIEVKVPTAFETAILNTTTMVALILAGLIAALSVYVIHNRGRAEPSTEAIHAGASRAGAFLVEEVLVVYADGRLILDCARPECRTMDADLLSGMLIAVQGLIQDGLERGGLLESIKFGENTLMLASGEYIRLAVVLYGEADEEFKTELTDTVSRIEASFAGIIERWTGEPDALAGLEEMTSPLIDRTAHLTRDDVSVELAEARTSLLSAIDFHRGYVRLKVAAMNSTQEMVADAAMEFQYNHDMLRLERVEPDTLRIRGDRIYLGSVRPGEKVTVALLFDPQICQQSHIDGSMLYYDSHGELQRVEMKRRRAEVVCPIFFTTEHANTAMLRKLIKEKLHLSDLRAFRYPETLHPEDVLEIARSALTEDNLQTVREYVVPGPPYEAEVWYYGETRVRGYQVIIRLGVLEESGILEVFAASTSMEPVTGLLAEFRRELQAVMEQRSMGEVSLEVESDEAVRTGLRERELLLHRMDEAT